MGRATAIVVFSAAMMLASAAGSGSVSGTDDASLTRLALCQDSWLDWKDHPAQMKLFGDHVYAEFSRSGDNSDFVPKGTVSVAGLRVVQAFPDSVGMGVGFSLLVDAPFDKARAIVEHALGRKLAGCEASDGMHSCELHIAEKRDVTVMAQDNIANRTLVGCYYFYEK
ncbi:MAG TPA: hypothetical protein VGG48_07115 [Rhizomicrobium sp.]